MKIILIFLFVVSNIIFSGGSIDFKKTKDIKNEISFLKQKIKRNEIKDVEEQEVKNSFEIEASKKDEIKEIDKIKKYSQDTKKKNELIKYIKKQNPKLNNENIIQILNLVWKYSKINKIDPYFVLAVMNVESHFNHFTVSNAGAKGLMQLMPFNFNEFKVDNSIEGNIKGGVLHLKRDYDKTKSLTKTLVCYNAGCSRIENDKWKKIKETREYIPKVIEKYKKLVSL